ncbi:hypothetical protein I316_05032 [Kwoniella heveanensis BCC8398]|uniref:Uncharacterized protein n=1 Tax=Kwoniella heveanensis BCC8398 TaxID=1296120 RepID=A0A1B9GQK6_9TREE|nr:hypothetical protein I316_05032 [Kwoniella heveanensis BCC8398]
MSSPIFSSLLFCSPLRGENTLETITDNEERAEDAKSRTTTSTNVRKAAASSKRSGDGEKEDEPRLKSRKKVEPDPAKHIQATSPSKPRHSLSSLVKPAPPPFLGAASLASKNKRASTSKSAPTGGNALPFTASTRPVGKRKFKEKSSAKAVSSGDEEEGEWDENKITWLKKAYPSTDTNKAKPASGNSKTDNEATVINVAHRQSGQNTPNGKKLKIPSSTPPLTDLRTPAIATSAQAQALYEQQAHRANHRTAKRPEEIRLPSHGLYTDGTSPLAPKARFPQKEPLFLSKPPTVTASPDHQSLIPPPAQPVTSAMEYGVEEETEVPRSPIARPREPSPLGWSTSEDEEDEPMPNLLPVPEFLSHKRSGTTSRRRSLSLSYPSGVLPPLRQPTHLIEAVTYQSAPSSHLVIIPNSEISATQAHEQSVDHSQAVQLSPSINGLAESKSKSSRRKKTYGRGRTHAFQHGVPLPPHESHTQRRSPPCLPHEISRPSSPDSYRGAKRKGSTSVWPDEGVIYGDHVPDSFLVPDHQSLVGVERKRTKFVRNGPPPEARRKGVIFVQDPDSPGSPRWRKRGSAIPRIPLTDVFGFVQSQGEVKYKKKSHLEEKKSRRRRRRELERRKDQRERRTDPILELRKDNGVEERMDHWKQNVAETLRWHRRTGTKAHRKLKRIPGWALKPIDTVKYEDYVEQYKQNLHSSEQPAKSRSSASRSSKPQLGDRINELISAGRRSRYEDAIRHPHKRSKICARGTFPKLRLRRSLSPSSAESDLDDIVDGSMIHNSRVRGPTKCATAAKRVLKLSLSKSDHKRNNVSSETVTPRTSRQTTSDLGVAMNVLGHQSAIHHQLGVRRRNEMPLAFRPRSSPALRGSPDCPEVYSRIQLSESPPNNHEPVYQLPEQQQLGGSTVTSQPHGQIFLHDLTLLANSNTDNALPAGPHEPVERPSEVLRSIARLVTPQTPLPASQNCATHRNAGLAAHCPAACQNPQLSEDTIIQPSQRPAPTEGPEVERNHPPVHPQAEFANTIEPLGPPATQFDLDTIVTNINASQLERLDGLLEQEEVERVSKRGSSGQNTSRNINRSNAETVSAKPQVQPEPKASNQADVQRLGARQTSLAPADRQSLAVSHVRNLSPTSVQPSVAQHSGQSKHNSRSSSSARMTGFQFTQQLITKPLPIEVARDIGNTFIPEPSKSSAKTRAGRDSARARRVAEKRKREKRQTQLTFEPAEELDKDEENAFVPVIDKEPDLIDMTSRQKASVITKPSSEPGPGRHSAMKCGERVPAEMSHGDRRTRTAQGLDIGLPRQQNRVSRRPKERAETGVGRDAIMTEANQAITAAFKPPSHDPSHPYRFRSQPQHPPTECPAPSLIPTEVSTQLPPCAQPERLSRGHLREIWAEPTKVSEMDKIGRVKEWRTKSPRAGRSEVGSKPKTDIEHDENDEHASKRFKPSRVAHATVIAQKGQGSGDKEHTRSKSSNDHRRLSSRRGIENEVPPEVDQSRGERRSGTYNGTKVDSSKPKSSKTEHHRKGRNRRYLSAAEYIDSQVQ